MTTRRNFLQSLMIAASALAVDPEKLLWTPGAKKIFIPTAPKPVVWRAVEVLVGNEYRPIDFWALSPGQWFRFVDDPSILMRSISGALPCEPVGNFMIHTDKSVNLESWSGVDDVALAV